MITVRSEKPGDAHVIYAVHAACFPAADEAKLVDLLHTAGHLSVSLVARNRLYHFVLLALWVGNTGWHWPSFVFCPIIGIVVLLEVGLGQPNFFRTIMKRLRCKLSTSKHRS
jgi:hypothetical protein